MKLKIFENGPIAIDVEEEMAVSADSGVEQKKGPLFLCRCGQSADKPWCDGTHRKIGFEGPGSEISVA